MDWVTGADLVNIAVFFGAVALLIYGIQLAFRHSGGNDNVKKILKNDIIKCSSNILDSLPIMDLKDHWFAKAKVYHRDRHELMSLSVHSDIVHGDRDAVLAYMEEAGLMGFDESGDYVAIIAMNWSLDMIQSTAPTGPGGRIFRFVRTGKSRWEIYSWPGGRGGSESAMDPEFCVADLMLDFEKWPQWLDRLSFFRT